MTKKLLILSALCTIPAMCADISGTWKLEGDIAGVHISRVCSLKQAANKLTGTCKGPMNEVSLTGDVNGNDIAWTYDAMYEGAKVTLAFRGTLDASAIKGKIESSGASGDFTASKQ